MEFLVNFVFFLKNLNILSISSVGFVTLVYHLANKQIRNGTNNKKEVLDWWKSNKDR